MCLPRLPLDFFSKEMGDLPGIGRLSQSSRTSAAMMMKLEGKGPAWTKVPPCPLVAMGGMLAWGGCRMETGSFVLPRCLRLTQLVLLSPLPSGPCKGHLKGQLGEKGREGCRAQGLSPPYRKAPPTFSQPLKLGRCLWGRAGAAAVPLSPNGPGRPLGSKRGGSCAYSLSGIPAKGCSSLLAQDRP